MTDITVETQTLIDAGGFDDEGGDLLFLRRHFDDQEQAILEPKNGPAGIFRLSQVQHRNFLSKPRQQDFGTLEEALAEAEVWRQKVKVGEDAEMREEWDAYLERKAAAEA